MSRRWCTSLVLGLLAATCSVLGGSPAQAEDRTVRDVRGDHRAPTDIVRVRVLNGSTKITVDTRTRNVSVYHSGATPTYRRDHPGAGAGVDADHQPVHSVEHGAPVAVISTGCPTGSSPR